MPAAKSVGFYSTVAEVIPVFFALPVLAPRIFDKLDTLKKRPDLAIVALSGRP